MLELLCDIQEDPACGWCDDGSNRGTGTCMPGGFSGPVTTILNTRTELVCSASRWFFTSCPPCQCNGHSTCIEGTQKCNQPCLDLTEGIWRWYHSVQSNLITLIEIGPHCETCSQGYFGNPVNGGTCSPCQCKEDEINITALASHLITFDSSNCRQRTRYAVSSSNGSMFLYN